MDDRKLRKIGASQWLRQLERRAPNTKGHRFDSHMGHGAAPSTADSTDCQVLCPNPAKGTRLYPDSAGPVSCANANGIWRSYERMADYSGCRSPGRTLIGLLQSPGFWKILDGRCDLWHCILKTQTSRSNPKPRFSVVQRAGIGTIL